MCSGMLTSTSRMISASMQFVWNMEQVMFECDSTGIRSDCYWKGLRGDQD